MFEHYFTNWYTTMTNILINNPTPSEDKDRAERMKLTSKYNTVPVRKRRLDLGKSLSSMLRGI